MRQTGIVRRMDELGRVVIPKELRRTMRIREGEEVEVFQKDDTLVLKKYSAVGEMIDFQLEYASSIYRTTGFTAIITDTDRVVAVSGELGSITKGTPIGEILQDLINGRRTEAYHKKDLKPLFLGDINGVGGQVVAPIISSGDAMGAVVLYTKKEPTELALKTAETASHFLAQRL